jgi:hypothetical protein
MTRRPIDWDFVAHAVIAAVAWAACFVLVIEELTR